MDNLEVVRSHKIRLVPNKSHLAYFKKACGTSRFAYNWGLAKWQERYEQGLPTGSNVIRKEFNSIKKEEFPWTSEVTKCAPEQAFVDLQQAFSRFFNKTSKYPKFKKKGKSKDSFYLSNEAFQLSGNYIKIPKLGWVKLREALRFEGKILRAVISRTADQWYVSITVRSEVPMTGIENQNSSVGVDLGLNTFAMLSDETSFTAPKPLAKFLKKLRKLQKAHARKQLGSNNRKKSALKIAKLYNKIANIRKDFLHKTTHYIATSYKLITIENLAVANMLKNHKLSRAISDIGLYKFKEFLTYKVKLYCSKLIEASRWFASTKICFNCGQVKEKMSLTERIYICDCGHVMDRDLNASKNLDFLGTSTVGSTESYACGQLASA